MSLLKKLFDSFVYYFTEKPKFYIRVDNPRTLQDYRQIQYNNWCKVKGVYNGSYLPKNPDKLTAFGKKGWFELKGNHTKVIRNFQRKSTGQKVRFDAENLKQYDHYHWYNPAYQKKYKLADMYIDRYGNACWKKSRASHLAPLDKDYIEK